MKNFILPEEAGQAILNYLTKQPYVEVFQLVGMMSTLKVIEDKEPEEPIKEVKK